MRSISDFQGQASLDQLGSEDHLFISSVAAGSTGLEKFLAGVLKINLVECETVLAMVKAGIGLGGAVDLPPGRSPPLGKVRLSAALLMVARRPAAVVEFGRTGLEISRCGRAT